MTKSIEKMVPELNQLDSYEFEQAVRTLKSSTFPLDGPVLDDDDDDDDDSDEESEDTESNDSTELDLDDLTIKKDDLLGDRVQKYWRKRSQLRVCHYGMVSKPNAGSDGRQEEWLHLSRSSCSPRYSVKADASNV